MRGFSILPAWANYPLLSACATRSNTARRLELALYSGYIADTREIFFFNVIACIIPSPPFVSCFCAEPLTGFVTGRINERITFLRFRLLERAPLVPAICPDYYHASANVQLPRVHRRSSITYVGTVLWNDVSRKRKIAPRGIDS